MASCLGRRLNGTNMGRQSVSEKWHRMDKFLQGLRQVGGKKVKARLLQVECKTSIWFHPPTHPIKLPPKTKGCPQYKGWSTWPPQISVGRTDTCPRTPLIILGSIKNWSQSVQVVVSNFSYGDWKNAGHEKADESHISILRFFLLEGKKRRWKADESMHKSF